jgi:hypothetical protein
MKRSLCISPLIALFIVQMLCVNNEKVVSSWKYGDTGILLGDASYFRLDTYFSLFTHSICTINRAIKGLMHRDLFMNTPSRSL